MRKFRQGSLAQRLAVGMIAIYALLLHGFLAPPAMSLTGAEVICALDSSEPGSARSGHKHHHGQCCIIACAACCAAYVASVVGLVEFPAQRSLRVGFRDADAIGSIAPLEFYFAARGPPHLA
jgi:hypothetical protein